MFRTIARILLPNPLDKMIQKVARRGGKRILLGWNRGLGDIALGLYAIVHRIRSIIPDAEIVFATRENLLDGFSMLEGVRTIGMAAWKRGEPYFLGGAGFDLVIQKPSPTDWCRWQRGKLTPRLKWDIKNELLFEKFGLSDEYTYVGVQVSAETSYGLWRNWPIERWQELFDRLESMGRVKVLLFGFGSEPKFSHPNLVDLRGKTTLFELLSIIKNRCWGLVLPDSGISSMTYYLDCAFSLRFVSLWGDPNHGILKQGVASPNPMLVHIPLVAKKRDLSTVSADQVVEALFPSKQVRPLKECVESKDLLKDGTLERAACVILAGGQGSRLGIMGPKGMFEVGGKSLFAHLIEKVPPSMPIAVMTSPLNHEETVAYLKRFGRKIDCFQQGTLPLLDREYQTAGEGPDGNGCVFEKLLSSGLVDEFEGNGVDSVFFVPIENPLADPADKAFLTHHRACGNDLTLKCVRRKAGERNMGVLVEGPGVVEYVDLTEEQIRSEQFCYANIGQFIGSMRFIRKAAAIQLPVHWVRKNGLWKRERFVFDAFVAAEKGSAVCYPRELCYAPIKSLETVQWVEEAIKMAGTV